MAALVQHRAGCAHRVADTAQRGDGSRRAVGPAHERGVVRDAPALIQHSAAAGVEQRVVLEDDDRGLDRGQRVAPGGQHGVAGLDGVAHALLRSPYAASGHFPAPPWTTIATSATRTRYGALSRPRDELRRRPADDGDLPVGRGGHDAVARVARRLEAHAVVPPRTDHDGRALGRRVEVAHREVELPGHERARAVARPHARAVEERVAPARGGDHAIELRVSLDA